MAFDGLAVFGISKELNSILVGGKIDKIFEPNSNEIILGIYCNGIKYALNIVVSSNNYRICLTTSPKPNPTFAPNFCMVLRKHLLNTRIVSISTSSLERVVTIEFEGHNKSDDINNKRLIIELMGKHSNVILINSNNTIIDSLKHFSIESNSYRNILPNYKYAMPIANKLDFLSIKTEKEFCDEIFKYFKKSENNNLTLSEAVSNVFIGISQISIKTIIQELKIENNLLEENCKLLYNYLLKIMNNPSKLILSQISNKEFSVLLQKTEKEKPLQMNLFIDDYFSKKENLEFFINYRNNLSKLILNYMKKLEQRLYNINKKLSECTNTDLYKLYGELITSNMYKIKQQHLDEIILENYYDNNSLVTIPLDKSISPLLNAKNYFKKYRKLKNAKIIVEQQKEEVENEIKYLESIIYEFELATTVTDIDNIYNEFYENFLNTNINRKLNKIDKKKKSSKKENKITTKIGEPIKCIVDNFTVLIGKNNKQNDYITKKSNPDDIWFHAKDIHGSHVILKTENKVPSQNTINKCASFAAFYSKASQSSNVSVDYTYIKYVKKASNSKPGMVIYTNYKNVIVKPKKAE